MKRSRNTASSQCLTRQQLIACLEPIGEPAIELQTHIGECAACQERLEQLSAPAEGWSDVAIALKTAPPASSQRIARSVCPLRDDGVVQEGPSSDVAAFHCAHELETLQAKLAPASHPELLGRIDRYEIEQLVGYGGMGLVFRGHDTDLHRVVAIKTIASGLSSLGQVRKRFVQEARAVASLAHPHIVSVHDIITSGPVPAIVMQYVAGPTLDQHLQDQGAMPWRAALQLGVQLCDALDTAHRSGLIHRDIKPGNVLLEADCTRAMLTDFGLVRVLDNKTITRTGVLAGTPEFMSPEQAWGKTLDTRSDLFSLGSLLYTMLAGKSPFAAMEPMAALNLLCNEPHRPLAEHSDEIPRQVTKLVDKLLAKQPRRRYASAAEVRDQMQDLLQSDIRLESPTRLLRRRYLAAAIATCVLLCACGIYWLQPRFSEYAPISGYFERQGGDADKMLSREEAIQAALAARASLADSKSEIHAGYEVFAATAAAIRETQQATAQLELDVFGTVEADRAATKVVSESDAWPDFDREINDLRRSLGSLESATLQ